MSPPDSAEEPPCSLTFDEEHGAYYGRWYCRLCDAAWVDERAHDDEDSALAAARANYEQNHRRHSKRRR